MSLIRSFIGAAAGLLLSAGAALGHHAFSADFDANKPITLDGIVTKVELTNPHAYLYLEVKDQDGKTASWKVELASRVELANRWSETTLPIGQHVIMRGWQAGNGSLFANADSITMDSGHKLSGASSYYLDSATGALARSGANEPGAVGTSGDRRAGDQRALPATASALPFIGVLGTLMLVSALALRRRLADRPGVTSTSAEASS
ncbi:MAG: DUF6152 family protein [Vicinamibacterales bacterium]